MLYYNRVSTITKDHILGKAWEAQVAMLVVGKKCWVGFVKRWLLKNQPQEVASFLPPVQPPLEMAPQPTAAKGSTNQEARTVPPPSFPHTMLNVERVKDNMRLTFIEKLFTNCKIGTNVQTRYLRFKGMSYKSESYLCDISCVQL